MVNIMHTSADLSMCRHAYTHARSHEHTRQAAKRKGVDWKKWKEVTRAFSF